MVLPKAEYPLTNIYVYALDKEIPFRPFLVKEERLFESIDDSQTLIKNISQCITNCSLGEVDGTTLPIFDTQNIWVQLQKISNVDAPEYLIFCNECGEENEIVIDMDNFKMTVIEEHTNIITINDELRISMKYPTASMILTEQKNNQIDFFDIAALCIDKVEYGGEIISDATLEEKEEFIDNLTKDEFAKINLFFATIPVVENEVIFNCEKCEATNINTMNGYMSFSE
tara:strand:- start:2437 stop:3120 length:684 start_codon:yes stop_codon:yes gene_type:complete